MLKSLLRVVLLLLLSVSKPSLGQNKLDSSTLISCKFKELVDGSHNFVFGLTESKMQLVQVFTENTDEMKAGQIFIYDYIGMTDAKIYNLYKSGKVVLGVHRTKPALFYVLDSKSPIVGYCNKVLQ